MENRARNIYVQAIRGVAIFAVIWIHSRNYIKVDMTFDSLYYLFQRNLINFPVAVFFVLSGYFAPTNILSGGGYYTVLPETVNEDRYPLYYLVDCLGFTRSDFISSNAEHGILSKGIFAW